jgi:hypothetical protein
MPTNDLPPSAEPEYLGTAPAAQAGRRPGGRAPLIALASAGIVGVVAAGGWAALSLMSTGEQPAGAVPAGALAYASFDLDPSAAQKLEALRIIEKFPALDDELGLDAEDDLRRWAFEEMRPEGCTDVAYDDDVAPWIGDRVAVAALRGEAQGDEPVPMFALQVTDQDAAAAGLDALADCVVAGDSSADKAEGGDFGYAFVDDYAILAESTAAAEKIATSVAEGALADDDAFSRWTGEAGDPGIATVYVAPEALTVLAEVQERAAEEMPENPMFPDLPGAGPGMGPLFGPGLNMGAAEQLEELAEDFEGLATVLRFSDGVIEVEVAGGGVPDDYLAEAGRTTGVAGLPAGTGLALAFAMPEDWAETWLEDMGAVDGMPMDRMIAEAERETGLEIPDDLEQLLGDGVSVAVDGSIDPDVLEGSDLMSLPAGVRVEGDPDEIMPVVEKIRAAWGPESEAMVVEAGDGAVAFGTDPDYVASLAGDGGLGEEDSFRAVVTEADQAGSVMYVDFETGDAWVERLVTAMARAFGGPGGGEPEIHRNMDALDAMGASMWVDGDVVRGVFRLSTD